MKKTYKTILTFLFIFMVAFILTGCQNNTQTIEPNVKKIKSSSNQATHQGEITNEINNQQNNQNGEISQMKQQNNQSNNTDEELVKMLEVLSEE